VGTKVGDLGISCGIRGNASLLPRIQSATPEDGALNAVDRVPSAMGIPLLRQLAGWPMTFRTITAKHGWTLSRPYYVRRAVEGQHACFLG
jgi:hypothetical protein